MFGRTLCCANICENIIIYGRLHKYSLFVHLNTDFFFSDVSEVFSTFNCFFFLITYDGSATTKRLKKNKEKSLMKNIVN